MKAIDYIRKGWTQGEFARKTDGSSTYIMDPDAVCWCALGAINAAYDSADGAGSYAAREKLKAVIGGFIAKWNDDPERTYEEVITAFEKAVI